MNDFLAALCWIIGILVVIDILSVVRYLRKERNERGNNIVAGGNRDYRNNGEG